MYNLKEFYEKVKSIVEETGVLSNKEGYINSHKLVGLVHVMTENPEDAASYEVVDLEMDSLWGCSCPSGIRIILKRINEQKELG